MGAEIEINEGYLVSTINRDSSDGDFLWRLVDWVEAIGLVVSERCCDFLVYSSRNSWEADSLAKYGACCSDLFMIYGGVCCFVLFLTNVVIYHFEQEMEMLYVVSLNSEGS